LSDDLAITRRISTRSSTSISSLAEQTNILSINAAIGLPFGQMGKGFAVVAGEIRLACDEIGRKRGPD
jgi:hypothetical protein